MNLYTIVNPRLRFLIFDAPDAPAAPSLDKEKKETNQSFTSLTEEEKKLVWRWAKTRSALSAIRRCRAGTYKCHHHLDPKCGRERQRDLRALINSRMPSDRVASFATVTLAPEPGQSTRSAWEDLNELLRCVGKDQFWARNWGGAVRVTEAKWTGDRWNLHAHFLLVAREGVTPEEAERKNKFVTRRILLQARRLGLTVSEQGTHVEVVRSLPAVVNYITKQHATDAHGFGALHLAAAQGDADAEAAINDLQLASQGFFWHSRSGELRAPRAHRDAA